MHFSQLQRFSAGGPLAEKKSPAFGGFELKQELCCGGTC